MFNRDSGNEMGPARTTVRPRLRPDLGFPMNNGQPETGEEDFSGVDVYDPATDYIEPDFSLVKPATTAAQEFAENQDFLDTVQSEIDIAEETGKPPMSNSIYYDPTGAFGLRKGTSSIRRLPNGRFVTLTGIVMAAKKDARLSRVCRALTSPKERVAPNESRCRRERRRYKMIRFGQQGVSGDKKTTARSKSFKARHAKTLLRARCPQLTGQTSEVVMDPFLRKLYVDLTADEYNAYRPREDDVEGHMYSDETICTRCGVGAD